MATFKQESPFEKVYRLCSEILSIDIQKDLVRTMDLGSKVHFVNGIVEFEFINKAVNEIPSLDLNVLSGSGVSLLTTVLQQIVELYNGIKSFDPTKHNPTLRDSYLNRLKDLSASIIDEVTSLTLKNELIFKKSHSTALAEEEIRYLNHVGEEARKILSEIYDVKESVRSVAEEAGVKKHATVFAREAVEHENKANVWLRWLFGCVIGVIILAVGILLLPLSYFTTQPDATFIIQYSITKVVVFSAAFYALSLINRNYKAHKHNAIVNKHRQNALTTFETFIEGATDEQTKNAVLLQTTQSIFNAQNTGYNSSDGDVDMSTKVIEIFKNTAQNK